MRQLTADDSERRTVILKQLQVYEPAAAWNEPAIREWLNDPAQMEFSEGIGRLQVAIERHFERRNRLLREVHPLSIQINLQTGVANGVLVANTIDECARVVRALLLRELEFKLDSEVKGNKNYLYLREKITKSIFRVVTGDGFLTNAFWNFYLNPTEETYAVAGSDPDADYKKVRSDPYDLTRSGARQPTLFDFPVTREPDENNR